MINRSKVYITENNFEQIKENIYKKTKIERGTYFENEIKIFQGNIDYDSFEIYRIARRGKMYWPIAFGKIVKSNSDLKVIVTIKDLNYSSIKYTFIISIYISLFAFGLFAAKPYFIFFAIILLVLQIAEYKYEFSRLDQLLNDTINENIR